ncbi:uncharacterized protein LOC131604747 [Vicia villosa]|uniref:uncharacterized protein LOC131604747 n=1 Tax=Vicia villosa TaxID=3911 RepID=UPI00273BAAAD|nr:uncharacterized protein LOC131604747 [Vicia villosa]
MSNDSKSLSESNVTENVLTTSEDIVKVNANIPVGSSRYLLRLNCSDSFNKRGTSSVSRSSSMSQQSCDASPVSDSATPEESSNPNRILKVVPLSTISSDEVKSTKSKTPHAKWPKEGIRNKGAKPSSSNTLEELTKEGTIYVDKAITRIVTRILKENHKVHGIFVPLQTIMPYPIQNTSKAEVAHTSGCDPAEEEINKDGQGIAENTNVTEDVNDIEDNEHTKVNTETGTNVVDLDESAQVKSLVKDSIKKKSTFAGPVKSRAVAKSTWVGPSKSWSKVVPKKRKEREIVESESDVEVDVPDIPSRKKPTTTKLAARSLRANSGRWAIEDCLQSSKAYEKLVKEFVVNLSEDCGNNRSVNFIKVFVRGRTDEAQPELEVTDNKVCQVITTKQVNNWPLKEKLTARTKAKFDYGTYIFDQTMKHAGSFSGTHVPDIVMTSAETSKSGAPTNKAEVIAMLKETCKKLEARKISLEKMISTLEMDENEEFTDAVKMEDEDEQEKEVELEEDVEEESTSPTDGSEKGSYADTSSGSDSGLVNAAGDLLF